MIVLTVLRERWPTCAPLRFWRFKRLVKVRASAWLSRLSRPAALSRMVDICDELVSENEEDSDLGSWVEADDACERNRDGDIVPEGSV